LELHETRGAGIRAEVPDDIPSASNLIGQEITWTVSHASSTVEGGLINGDTSVLAVTCEGYLAPKGLIEDNLAPEGAAEGGSALEGAAEGDLAPEGAAEGDPAPKGPELSSSLAASMDVHVESPPVQFDEPAVTSFDLPTALAGLVTLEVSDPGVEDPLHAIGVEVPLGVALGMSFNPPLGLKSTLNIVSTSVPSFDGTLAPPALGLYLANFFIFSYFLFCWSY
jgi:hypothetical protein